MHVAVAVGERQFVTVVVLEGFEKTRFGGDYVVHFEVVE